MILAQKQIHRSMKQNRKSTTHAYMVNKSMKKETRSYNGKKSLQQMVFENWIATCKRMKLETLNKQKFLTSYTKIYSK